MNTGKLSQESAVILRDLANKNVTPEEYAATLDAMVKAGKISPEQARQLLRQYQIQSKNTSVAESAKAMDEIVKAGQLPLDSANELLLLQKQQATPTEYANELDRLVRAGKITPETAAKLLAQYNQQQAKDNAKANAYHLRQMAKSGEITPAVADELFALQEKNTPVAEYTAKLNQLVNEGKLTPAAANKLMTAYKAQRAQAVAAASGPMAELIASGNEGAKLAQRLLGLQAKNASVDEYTKELDAAVKAGIISPATADKLLAQYKRQGVQTVKPGSPLAELLASGEKARNSRNDYSVCKLKTPP